MLEDVDFNLYPLSSSEKKLQQLALNFLATFLVVTLLNTDCLSLNGIGVDLAGILRVTTGER